MSKQLVVRIIYQHKKTGDKRKITFRYALNEAHAMKIARKLRPRNYAILIVYTAAALDDSRLTNG